jgi:hypothetical protein
MTIVGDRTNPIAVPDVAGKFKLAPPYLIKIEITVENSSTLRMKLIGLAIFCS